MNYAEPARKFREIPFSFLDVRRCGKVNADGAEFSRMAFSFDPRYAGPAKRPEARAGGNQMLALQPAHLRALGLFARLQFATKLNLITCAACAKARLLSHDD
jgi:hypothetical protein